MNEWMVMEHWWNDINKENPTYSEMNVSQRRFVRLRFHIHCPGIEPRFRVEKPPNVSQVRVLILTNSENGAVRYAVRPYNVIVHPPFGPNY